MNLKNAPPQHDHEFCLSGYLEIEFEEARFKCTSTHFVFPVPAYVVLFSPSQSGASDAVSRISECNVFHRSQRDLQI